MRYVLGLLVLGSVLVVGVGLCGEAAVCTDPCGQEESGGCERPLCEACISLAVVPIPPEALAAPAAPIDRGAVPVSAKRPATDPPASEILHVPRPFLG